jgi:hypothetical protein
MTVANMGDEDIERVIDIIGDGELTAEALCSATQMGRDPAIVRGLVA